MAIQLAHVSVADQLITEWMPWKLEELFILISFRFY